MKRFKRYNYLFLILLVAAGLFLFSNRIRAAVIGITDNSPPVIDLWYGAHQSFGVPALSQRWVNVLGNAADPQSGIARLNYQINGGPVNTTRLGPDLRRLFRAGDFNLEIDPSLLHRGDNQVTITATNGRGLETTVNLTLTYTPPTTVLPLPFKIDWSTVKNVQDVLQIVDGKWTWDTQGIRTVELGYDRFLTVGDARWSNYQVTVPVTVHAIDPAGFHNKNAGEQASVSIDLRWIGHSDDPVQCDPPHCGWNPVGDFNKFFFRENQANYLALKLTEKEKNYPTQPYKLDPGDTYIFKVQVQTTAQGNVYSMKVWEKRTETEPAGWIFQRLVPTSTPANINPNHGAFSLVAHYADVTFGNVEVDPVK